LGDEEVDWLDANFGAVNRIVLIEDRARPMAQ
jgi:hypothetical protein